MLWDEFILKQNITVDSIKEFRSNRRKITYEDHYINKEYQQYYGVTQYQLKNGDLSNKGTYRKAIIIKNCVNYLDAAYEVYLKFTDLDKKYFNLINIFRKENDLSHYLIPVKDNPTELIELHLLKRKKSNNTTSHNQNISVGVKKRWDSYTAKELEERLESMWYNNISEVDLLNQMLHLIDINWHSDTDECRIRRKNHSSGQSKK